MRPKTSNIAGALKCIRSGYIEILGYRKTAGSHDEIARCNYLAGIRVNQPLLIVLVINRALNTRVKVNVLVEIEALRHVFDIVEDLRLGGIDF